MCGRRINWVGLFLFESERGKYGIIWSMWLASPHLEKAWLSLFIIVVRETNIDHVANLTSFELILSQLFMQFIFVFHIDHMYHPLEIILLEPDRTTMGRKTYVVFFLIQLTFLYVYNWFILMTIMWIPLFAYDAIHYIINIPDFWLSTIFCDLLLIMITLMWPFK